MEEQQSTPFQFEDPRHAEIHRRLLMVGPGAAGFYRDACQLMAQSDLTSITHLVAHLLREVESSLRAVLQPISTRNPALGTPSQANDRHKQEILAILQALSIEEDDPVAVAWLQLAGRSNEYALHARAHRRALASPRRLDKEFRGFWIKFTEILYKVLDRFEARYLESHQFLDELLEKETPTLGDAQSLRNRVPNNAAAWRYFFEKAGPQWLQPLQQTGFFEDPPETERDIEAGTVGYPPWPLSRYLARIASIDASDNQQTILYIAKEINDLGNITIQWDILDIALALPPELAIGLVAKAKEWATTPYARVADKLVDVVIHLASGGQFESALDLAGAVFAVKAEEQPSIPSPDGESHRLPPTLRPNFDSWEYQEAMSKVVPALAAADAERTLQWLADFLDAALSITGDDDYSYLWRPAIEDHGQNLERDPRDPAVSAIRDAALALVTGTPAHLPWMVKFLESRGCSLFRRIALHLLAHCPDAPLGLIAERLANKERFDEIEIHHEYFHLLKAWFPRLADGDKDSILCFIEDGPPHLEFVRGEHRKRKGEEMSDEDVAGFIGRWQRNRLAPICESLPAEWKERYDDLIEQFGEPEHPDFVSYISGGAVGPVSPMPKAELRSMNPDQIVAFLRKWQPAENAPFSFEEPTREGFARELQRVVKEAPDLFGAEAAKFRDLDATYVRGLLSGLEDAAKDEKTFLWEPAIELMRWIVDQPLEIPGREAITPLDSDPHWGWARKQAVRLLAHGFERETCEIPFDLRPQVWEVLKPVTDDPEPTPEYEQEYGGSNMDPATLAFNTVRGQAMHTAVSYGLWVRRNLEKLPDGSGRIKGGFQEMPELQEILERHLDPEVDSSLAVRSVYGHRLPHLVFLDQRWCAENLREIFPTEDRLLALRATAWETYLIFCRPYNTVVDLLQDEYSHAVAHLGQERIEWRHLGRSDTRLVEHLILLYCWGKISLEDGGMLELLYSQASEELREHAMDFVGRLLKNSDDVPDDWIVRIKELWAYRLGAAEANPAASRTELRSFGWWFVSGKFDDAWSVSELEKALRISHTVKPDTMVIEQLASIAPERQLESLHCLQHMISGAREPWAIYSWRESIRRIISEVLASSNQQARQLAIELVNRLAAQGHPEFSDLLS